MAAAIVYRACRKEQTARVSEQQQVGEWKAEEAGPRIPCQAEALDE